MGSHLLLQLDMHDAWPRGYKTFSCSTELSMKFHLVVKAKILNIE